MRKWIVVILLACIMAGPAGAQPTPGSAQSGLELDRYLAPLISLQVFSGTVLIARGESVLVERHYGFADVEHRIPIDHNSAFRIASISKSFTKVMIGRLLDQRRLSLDDRLSRWLPRIPQSDRITIRMLIEHRSGIPNVNSLRYDEEALTPNTLAMLVDSIAAKPLDFEPGTSRRYSNGGYAVLARVVEIIECQAFETVLERDVLSPLHLDHTFHERDGMIVDRVARGYMPSPVLANRLVGAPFQEMSTKTGGGSLVSNAGDLLAWSNVIGRSSVLSKTTWAALFPGADTLFQADGRSPGYNAFIQRDRTSGITVIVLANNYAAGMVSDIASAASAMTRGAAVRPLPVTAGIGNDPAEMSALQGEYKLPGGAFGLPPGSRVRLKQQDGHLVAYLGETPVDVLVRQGPGQYLARTLWLTLEARGTDRTSAIHMRLLYRDSEMDAPRIEE